MTLTSKALRAVISAFLFRLVLVVSRSAVNLVIEEPWEVLTPSTLVTRVVRLERASALALVCKEPSAVVIRAFRSVIWEAFASFPVTAEFAVVWAEAIESNTDWGADWKSVQSYNSIDASTHSKGVSIVGDGEPLTYKCPPVENDPSEPQRTIR